MHVHIFSRDGASRTAARHEQDVCVPAVAADMGADYAMSTAPVAQDRRACAVSKKDATVAIGPVRDRRQFLGPDHKDGVVRMRGNKLLWDLQAKEKTGAGCRNIETSGVGRFDLLLNEARRGREKHVGSGRCQENEID